MKKFVRSLAAVLSAVLLMGTVTGCSSVSMEDYSTTVAATYGDEEIYLDEVNFFLRYLQWYQEESYWEIYETYFGYEDMWEADSGNGSMTLGEYLKEVVMAQALQTRILLDHTEDYDIELTDEDVELAEEAVAELRDSFAEEFTNYSDASDEDILGWFEENLLANKVYEAVRQSTEVEVTDEECQMFTLQYVYVSETDEDEDTEDEDTDSDEDTEDEDELINEDLAEAVLACLEAGEDFDSIEDALGVSYSEASYLIAETEDDSELFAYGSEMSTGESVMFESESGGWYVIYCVSDLDEEATEEQRAEVEDELREEYFEEVYAEWAEEAPEFTVNKVWNQIVVGGGKIYVAKEDEEEDETEASEDETEDETEEEAEEETTEEAAEDETPVTEETEETTAEETETETETSASDSEETAAEETTEESTAVETAAGETTAAE